MKHKTLEKAVERDYAPLKYYTKFVLLTSSIGIIVAVVLWYAGMVHYANSQRLDYAKVTHADNQIENIIFERELKKNFQNQ